MRAVQSLDEGADKDRGTVPAPQWDGGEDRFRNAKSDGEVINPSPSVEEGYYAPSEDANFVLWLKRGFAFTLPILILGLSALLVFYFMHG